MINSPKAARYANTNPEYPSYQTRSYLGSVLGVPGTAMSSGGIDPIYYAFAGMPFGGSFYTNARGGRSYGVRPVPGGPGNPAGGGGNNPPGGGGTTNPPTGGGTTNPPTQTPWQYPNLLQSPLPFSLGPDWRRTMLYAGMTPPNP